MTSRRESGGGWEALAEQLSGTLRRHRHWFVLTGAGVSTDSGIPAYRDARGAWQHKQPIQYADFVGNPTVRQRYWARSAVGFARVEQARPNAAHRALARFQELGWAPLLVTQNVDGLHQKAGASRVIDLHGRLDVVQCLDCSFELTRTELQVQLLAENPWLRGVTGPATTPDGDAELEEGYGDLQVPDCPRCAGVLKPGVVFFGEAVPASRRAAALAGLESAEAVLVVGSSLMVFSGLRFVRRAAAARKPIVIVNQGVTRADALASAKLEGPCGPLLAAAIADLPES